MAQKRTTQAMKTKAATDAAMSAALALKSYSEELGVLAKVARSVLGETRLTSKMLGLAGAMALSAQNTERRLKEV